MKTTNLILFFACAVFFAFSTETKAQTKTINLFNGENLEGWGFVVKDTTVDPNDVFRVKNGLITISGEPFGYMYTEQKFTNFHLHVEWRWPIEGTNSGIFLYVQDDKTVWPNTVECQLQAGNAGDFVKLGNTEIKEFVSGGGQQRPEFPKKREASSENPIGEWNVADITSENGVLTIYINGVFQNKGISTEYTSGRIALQSEGKDIQFRNVRVTPVEN